MFPLADALSVPVASTGPVTLRVEFSSLSHVDPSTVPVIPPAAVVVTVFLFVTVIAPVIAIVPVKVIGVVVPSIDWLFVSKVHTPVPELKVVPLWVIPP